MSIIAIIGAREGSKGVPGKNIHPIAGHPMLAYSIAAAKLSKLIDRVIVSTDSQEYADIAERYGAEVPFLRPAELALDGSTDLDYMKHALDWLMRDGEEPEMLVQLRPTTPLRDPELIDKAINLQRRQPDSSGLRSAFEIADPPQKMLAIDENGLYEGLFPEDPRPEYFNLPRQVFPPAYLPNGYVDIVLPQTMLSTPDLLYGERVLPFITPNVPEIDLPGDFDYLEYIFDRQATPLSDYLSSVTADTGLPASPEPIFSLEPKSVSKINTPFRSIQTAIPSPGTKEIFEDLAEFESRSMHGQLPIVWDRAVGFQVYDHNGNCWIDFTSTIFVANAGHGNPLIKEALREIIDRPLLHTYNFASRARAEYLKKLIAFTPVTLEKAYLVSSGTEATECALKLIRMAASSRGKRKPGIISFEGAMHGRTLGSALMGGTPEGNSWIGFSDPNIHQLSVPYPWELNGQTGAEKAAEDLENLAARGIALSQDIGGIVFESYLGWGAYFYPKDYVKAMVAFAKKENIIVCFDEIQSGFGRTGKLFAYEHYGVEADLVCCGKGMSSSLPLAAVLGRSELLDTPNIGSMSSTHSANPMICAAGMANIQAIEQGNLIDESKRKGKLLRNRLDEIQARYPNRVKYVFGMGMVAAILLFDPDTGWADAKTASNVCLRALEKGLILVHTGRESIKIGPPLNIPDEALFEGLDVLEESLSETIANKI